MGGLILCRNEEAKKPYYMSSLGIYVYSLEELCYAIHSNIYLLDNDFVDEKLIEFVRDDTKDKWLADELTFLREKKAGLRELAITILLYVDYYTKAEVDELRILIDSLGSLNGEERIKFRGDNFLNNNKYESAIRNYTELLNAKEHEMTDAFYGNVFHNTAVAYAKLFLFTQAAECFKRGYVLNKSEESLKQYYMAVELAGIESDIEEELADDSLKNMAMDEMGKATNKILSSAEYIEIASVGRLKTEGKLDEYNDAIKQFFEKWKADYISATK